MFLGLEVIMPLVLPLTDAKIKALYSKEKVYKVFDGHGLG
jgi:hypothetical protein